MNLGARYGRFSRKVTYIAAAFRRAAEVAVPRECVDAHTLSREAATVFLQDQWNVFCRDLVINSWQGGVTTLGGMDIPVRSGPRSKADAMRVLRGTYTGKLKKAPYWEPKWFDATATIDAARRLGIPNFTSVAAGVGGTPSPLDELRAVRNYFAHRGRDTSDRLGPV